MALVDKAAAFKKSTEYYDSIGVSHEESFVTNSRGMKLCASQWLPLSGDSKALVFLCHGYAIDSSILFGDTGEKIAAAGYAVFGLDYEGHGQSDGIRGYFKDVNDIADDCATHFKSIREMEPYKSKPRFIMGESLGGAVVLLIHRKEPNSWNGVILMAPMCKIADNMKPPEVVTTVLKLLARLIPKAPIVPTKDVISESFRDPEYRAKVRSNPCTYLKNPRLASALAMLNCTEDLTKRLDEVTLPFLLLHGEDDKVTDPEISRLLFEMAKSLDKTFKLYPGMWHCLTDGELKENSEIVYKDIFEWLDSRSKAGAPPS